MRKTRLRPFTFREKSGIIIPDRRNKVCLHTLIGKDCVPNSFVRGRFFHKIYDDKEKVC